MDKTVEQIRPIINTIIEEEIAVGKDGSVGSRIVTRIVEAFNLETPKAPLRVEVQQTDTMLRRGAVGFTIYGLPSILPKPVEAKDLNCSTCKWQVGSSCRTPHTVAGVDCWSRDSSSWEPSDEFMEASNV